MQTCAIEGEFTQDTDLSNNGLEILLHIFIN